MALTGLPIGWRIRAGFLDGVLGFALFLLMGFAMIWVGILVGSPFRSVEAVQGFMFTVMFPLTFLANTFAPTEHMPRLAALPRRVEPGLRAHPGRARAVGQRPARAGRRRAAAAPPGAVHDRSGRS